MNFKLPTIPELRPSPMKSNKSLFSENLRDLLNLVYGSKLPENQKFDIIDSLSYLALDGTSKDEQPIWSQFRKDFLSQYYGETSIKEMGKGYVFWYRDATLYFNRKTPPPSEQTKARLVNLGFMCRTIKSKGSPDQTFWQIKLDQTKTLSRNIFGQLQMVIDHE